MRYCRIVTVPWDIATQGMKRKHLVVDRHSGHDWRTFLARRLLSQFDRLPHGDSTSMAEHELGMEASAYWFLGRVARIYDRVLSIWRIPPSLCHVQHARLSPFDTGGVASGKYHLLASTDHDSKSFVQDHSYSIGTVDQFHFWVAEAFDDPKEYISGRVLPSAVSHPGSDCSNCILVPTVRSAEDWSWELRVPVADLPNKDFEPQRIFWTLGEFDEFHAYVLTEFNSRAQEHLLKFIERQEPFSSVDEARISAINFLAGVWQ